LVRAYWTAAHKAWNWSRHVYRLNPNSLRLFKRHLRWATAAALRPESALAWFSFHEDVAVEAFTQANPRLIFRALTRYMAVNWGLERRTKVIQDTYLCLLGHGGFLAEAMRQPGGLVLARFDLDRGQKGLLRLGSDAQFRKEGEISVFLELEGVPGAITGLAFSLELGTGLVVRIGGLQGRKGGDEETIKLATKAMHGLRPKNLMVLVIQEVARALGATELQGVGNSIQVYRARVNNPLVPKRDFRFDFDALWTEVGGVPLADGWFRLPLVTPRRTPEEVKPNKRSLYAKRYALQDELSRQIREALAEGTFA